MPLWLSDHAQDFLSHMLVKDSARRSTAAQLLKHPWLKSLGFKPPVEQMPSSVQVIEPVLPPRPVVPAQPEPKATTDIIVVPSSVEKQVVEEEDTIKAVVPEEAEAAPAGSLLVLNVLTCAAVKVGTVVPCLHDPSSHA